MVVAEATVKVELRRAVKAGSFMLNNSQQQVYVIEGSIHCCHQRWIHLLAAVIKALNGTRTMGADEIA